MTSSSRSGLVAVFVAVLALLLIALIGLAVDQAYVANTHQELQRAADAAALAAVRLVESEVGLDNDYAATRQAAMQVALANPAASIPVVIEPNAGNDPSGDIVVGHWDAPSGSFSADTGSPNAVRVRVRRLESASDGPLDLIFGPAFGMESVGVCAVATAIVGGAPAPVVLVLDPTGPGALKLNGTELLDAPHGLIQVNSDNRCAIQLLGTPLVSASMVATSGGICAAEGLISGAMQQGAPSVADPLADLLPDGIAWTALEHNLDLPLGQQGAIDATGQYAPGRYPGGLELDSQESVTLLPGIYMLGGPGLILRGGASLAGEHVALLIGPGGIVDIRGNTSATWTAPDDGLLAGVALFSHRDNTGLAVSIGGDGHVSIGGTVYAPHGTMRLAGGPDKTVGSLIVHRLEDSGTPRLTVTGPGPEEAEPAIYLVE